MQEDISIWDGTNSALIENAIPWHIGGERNPSNIKRNFELVCKGLLGTDRLEGPSSPGMDIQVARYYREVLHWTQTTSEVEFVQNVFYKIDHPEISIWPTGWVSLASGTFLQGAHWSQKMTMSFDNANQLRKDRLAEQQKKSGEGAGNDLQKPAEPHEDSQSDAENLRGRACCT